MLKYFSPSYKYKYQPREKYIMSATLHCEKQYLNLINRIITTGNKISGRNGNCLSVFGAHSEYDLTNGKLPLLTTKKLAWKTCLKELLWFINGDTNNSHLKEQNVKIWNGNASREFLDSRDLSHYPEDILGPVYGWQWRNFNGKYDYTSNDGVVDFTESSEKRYDQLQYIIDALNNTDTETADKKENRWSRRLIMSAWNPVQLNMMALPPCHVLCQVMVDSDDTLSMTLYQRSGDVGLGVPFNIASYAFLAHLLAHHCGLKTGKLYHTIGIAHIYEDHIEPLKTQLTREPFDFPTLEFNKKYDDINDYCFDDFVVKDYKYHKPIKMNMTA